MNGITTMKFHRSVFLLAVFFAACGLPCCSVLSAELTLKVIDKEPPKELDTSIRQTLQSKAVQVLDGEKPAFEFWFRSEIPLQSKPASPAKALDAPKQTTLLGAVAIPSPRRDYRDDPVSAGIYTMRFALQPQDGNHLGTAEYLYFAVLVPAKLDTKLDGIADYKALVKASSKETSTDHPMVLSLRPAASEEGELPKLNEPAPHHKSVRVKVPAKAGPDKTAIAFEVVCEGKAEK
jgi:hypothetical protein